MFVIKQLSFIFRKLQSILINPIDLENPIWEKKYNLKFCSVNHTYMVEAGFLKLFFYSFEPFCSE